MAEEVLVRQRRFSKRLYDKKINIGVQERLSVSQTDISCEDPIELTTLSGSARDLSKELDKESSVFSSLRQPLVPKKRKTYVHQLPTLRAQAGYSQQRIDLLFSKDSACLTETSLSLSSLQQVSTIEDLSVVGSVQSLSEVYVSAEDGLQLIGTENSVDTGVKSRSGVKECTIEGEGLIGVRVSNVQETAGFNQGSKHKRKVVDKGFKESTAIEDFVLDDQSQLSLKMSEPGKENPDVSDVSNRIQQEVNTIVNMATSAGNMKEILLSIACSINALGCDFKTEIGKLKADREEVNRKLQGFEEEQQKVSGDLSKVQSDMKLAQEQISDLNNIVIRQEHIINECKKEIEELQSNGGKKQLIFHGFKCLKGENCRDYN